MSEESVKRRWYGLWPVVESWMTEGCLGMTASFQDKWQAETHVRVLANGDSGVEG